MLHHIRKKSPGNRKGRWKRFSLSLPKHQFLCQFLSQRKYKTNNDVPYRRSGISERLDPIFGGGRGKQQKFGKLWQKLRVASLWILKIIRIFNELSEIANDSFYWKLFSDLKKKCTELRTITIPQLRAPISIRTMNCNWKKATSSKFLAGVYRLSIKANLWKNGLFENKIVKLYNNGWFLSIRFNL